MLMLKGGSAPQSYSPYFHQNKGKRQVDTPNYALHANRRKSVRKVPSISEEAEKKALWLLVTGWEPGTIDPAIEEGFGGIGNCRGIMGMIHKMVNSRIKRVFFKNAMMSSDDMVSAVMMDAYRAAQLYDPSTGNRFTTYATGWIKKGVGEFCDRNIIPFGYGSRRRSRKDLDKHLPSVSRFDELGALVGDPTFDFGSSVTDFRDRGGRTDANDMIELVKSKTTATDFMLLKKILIDGLTYREYIGDETIPPNLKIKGCTESLRQRVVRIICRLRDELPDHDQAGFDLYRERMAVMDAHGSRSRERHRRNRREGRE